MTPDSCIYALTAIIVPIFLAIDTYLAYHTDIIYTRQAIYIETGFGILSLSLIWSSIILAAINMSGGTGKIAVIIITVVAGAAITALLFFYACLLSELAMYRLHKKAQNNRIIKS